MKPQRPQSNTLCSPKEFPLKDITERVISCAIEVHVAVIPRLLKNINIYEESLPHEFKLSDILYERQKEITLKYKGKVVGKHRIVFPLNH